MRQQERRFKRLENWLVLGDGLFYKIATIDSRYPLTATEVLHMIRTDNAVINIFNALTGEFIGMAYASAARKQLEEVLYDDTI